LTLCVSVQRNASN